MEGEVVSATACMTRLPMGPDLHKLLLMMHRKAGDKWHAAYLSYILRRRVGESFGGCLPGGGGGLT